tara:strand:- start:880 stop:1320 length:441 start_codon:yes stop_codon:yes gene_type:complete
MLAGYGALGMVVGGILPFMILMWFSVQLAKGGQKNRGGQLFAKFVWFAFIIFLVWKLIDGMYYCELGTLANDNVTGCINKFEGWIYLVLIILAIVWIWFMEKWVINLLFKNKLESDKEWALRRQKKLSASGVVDDAVAARNLGNTE